MKLKLIGSKSLWRELFYLSAQSAHYIEITLLDQEAASAGMLREELLRAEGFDAVAVAFGASHTEGLSSPGVPLIVPIAHDCMGLLLGDLGRYRKVFEEAAGEPVWVTEASSIDCPCLETACLVQSPVAPALWKNAPEGTREYAADLSLLKALVDGNWDSRFLTVLSGMRVERTYDASLLKASPVSD